MRLAPILFPKGSLCISIHAPLAGCDSSGRKKRSRRLIFQSTHPLRGATFVLVFLRKTLDISIHAPLAGCDCKRETHAFVVLHFNPRTPCGVRQKTSHGHRLNPLISIHAPLAGCDHIHIRLCDFLRISIHAPLAGCDLLISSIFLCAVSFQSTHPLRGATRWYLRKQRRSYYFNPRTPCGVRPQYCPSQNLG